MTLPEALYRAAQVRELDRIAIEERGIPGSTLMERAGKAAYTLLRTLFPRARRIAVICGPGNNGGDGYVVARLAHEAGLEVEVMSVGETARVKGDAAAARRSCEHTGVAMRGFDANRLPDHDVIVDALLGTGLEREVQNEWRAAIEAINCVIVPTVALDIPSGLHADTGQVLGAAVRARATITFIGLKAGLYTSRGREHGGAIYFDGLGVPSDIYTTITPYAQRITESALQGQLTTRPRDAHKGDAGHVLVIGGEQGMMGAVRMAGEAAYRAGAGLVSIATHPAHAAQVSAARPELLSFGVNSARDLSSLLSRAKVIALGPGIGQGKWARALMGAAMDARLPMVVDADALNLLAADPAVRGGWILTPHPGEAARLLGVANHDIQNDRFAAAHAIAARYGGICVLKGLGTLIASQGNEVISLCDQGNPGMASGGMGDILTGVIAALLAQGLGPLEAARVGVWVHATAGDDAAGAGGEIGLLATDLLPYIRARINRLVADGSA